MIARTKQTVLQWGRWLAAIAPIFFPMTSIARANEGQPEFPADSLAWWSFDPSLLGEPPAPPGEREAAVVAAFATLFATHSPAPADLFRALAATLLCANPIRVAVVQADSPGFAAAIEVSCTVRPTDCAIAAERAIVAAGGFRLERSRSPGGVDTAACVREDPARCTIAWRLTNRSFVLASGVGLLDRWSAEVVAPDHVTKLRGIAAPRGARLAELFLDLNTLRRARPELFERGWVPQCLTTAGFANTRWVMLSAAGELQGPIHVGAAWSSRAWPPTRIEGVTAAGGAENELPIAWGRVIDCATDLCGVTFSNQDLVGFQLDRARWERRSGRRLERLIESLGSGIRIHGGLSSGHGEAQVLARSREWPSDLEAIVSSLPGIQYDQAARLWTWEASRAIAQAPSLCITFDREGRIIAAWDRDRALRERDR